MIYQHKKLLGDLLLGFFVLFLFGSTFSIALAQIGLGLSLILFIITVVVTKYNPFAGSLKWFYGCVGLYIGWMLLCSLLGNTPLESVLIMKEEWLFCAVPIGIYLLTNDTYRQKLVTIFAYGVGLFALYGLVQFFTGVHWFKSVAPNPGPEFGYVVKGNFPSPMTFGNYFATAGAFFAGYALAKTGEMDKKRRLLYALVAVIAIVATLASYNRGAILGLIVVFIVLSIVLRNVKVLLGVTAVFLLAAVVIASSTDIRDRLHNHVQKELAVDYEGGRLFIWNNSVKIICDHPVFGVGQGNYRYEYLKHVREDIPGHRKRVHAHNDLLNVGAIAGVPGLLFFAGIWVALFGYIRRAWRDSAASGALLAAALAGSLVFLVSSMTEATFADEEVRQMLMFIWAAGLFSRVGHPVN